MKEHGWPCTLTLWFWRCLSECERLRWRRVSPPHTGEPCLSSWDLLLRLETSCEDDPSPLDRVMLLSVKEILHTVTLLNSFHNMGRQAGRQAGREIHKALEGKIATYRDRQKNSQKNGQAEEWTETGRQSDLRKGHTKEETETDKQIEEWRHRQRQTERRGRLK